MMKRLLILTFILSIGLFAQTGVAKVAGRGELIASGNGVVLLRCAGNFKIEGTGCFWYKGDAELVTTGDVQKEVIGDWTFIANFSGGAEARGNDLCLSFSGKNISLSARGKGKAMLWGKGNFSAHHRTGFWGIKYLPISFTEGPRPKDIEKGKKTNTGTEGE